MKLPALARRDEIRRERALRIERRVRLRDHEVFLFQGGQEADALRDTALVDLAIRRFSTKP
jgi:hypothetical protein